MKRGDASFTFLSRIQEIEWNVQDGRWQSALALALTIPDICGGLEYPELVKRYRDGRIMEDRKGEPARDVGSQYIRWFNDFAADYFKRTPADGQPYLSGERCWQLRCEYLHQNKGFSNDSSGEQIYFHLGLNCGTSICMTQPRETKQQNGHIWLDIHQICSRMCLAARAYYETNYEKKDFSLYHTPVLDFVQQANPGEKIEKTIAIVCSRKEYAEGVKAALQKVSGLIEIFRSPEQAKMFLKKKKPALWIITEEMEKQKNQPWKADQVPVIILSKAVSLTAEEKYLWIPVPFSIEVLRDKVRGRLA